jgi:hypothetical protein
MDRLISQSFLIIRTSILRVSFGVKNNSLLIKMETQNPISLEIWGHCIITYGSPLLRLKQLPWNFISVHMALDPIVWTA